ncbi:unnamed protein product [Prorocentrum cordatum]|uniref:Tc1-like transposase DDE domain-containing protein n=1 Tax=Prorocentrum cordatum TaxID=2364126 RepID=A0ABN9U6A2_9DINO|nr:unnamed protein product [Polarella glacialis]
MESDRFKYCWGGATHMRGEKTEANAPALAGADEHDKQAVRDQKVTAALRALNPKKKRGPWTMLCVDEGFRRADVSTEAHRKRGIALWSVPPESPVLIPMEMFWGWLRKKLRSLGLQDSRKKRARLGKKAYNVRVKGGLEVGQGPNGGKDRGG